MIWKSEELTSPLSGRLLRRDSLHSLSDGETRFPVVEEIPFLRVNREELSAAALRKLDAGDEQGALILLLQDQDDWARDAPPTEQDLRSLFEDENLPLREAMRHLRYGAVADYFAYRWSDPTFLSGISLLENHLPQNCQTVYELCCGIGHYLREFKRRDIEATGADVVFSKLWLARRYVAPRAKLICLDANFGFPIANKCFDAAFCHDAFYFLPEKAHVVSELKRTTRSAILIGHAHNSAAENFSSGAAVSVENYAALFENPVLYDDAELTQSLIENRAPKPERAEKLKTATAISIAQTENSDEEMPENLARNRFTAKNMRINPLLIDEFDQVCSAPIYPSARYASEYGSLSGYLHLSALDTEVLQSIKHNPKNDLLDEKLTEEFARRRILLDLPERW